MIKRTPEETLEIMLKRVAAQDLICYDSETSGLDWRHNFICGHVLAFSPDPRDSYYLPVRHKGNANLGGVPGPRHARAWDESTHPGERALLIALDRKEKVIFGHNYGFDLKFKARTGAFNFNARCEDTQINAPLLDEHQRSYSLETCAEIEGVQAKKSKMIVDYIRSRIPAAAAAPEKQAMGWFWELPGDDPMAVEYATGDGTTTWQLRDKQLIRIHKPIMVSEDRYTDLTKVHGVENRLIRTLARMSFRGIKIDEQRLAEVIKIADDSIDRCLSSFPPGFNPKAPTQVEKFMRDNGVSGWPLTPTGKPSFPEDWLLTNEPGKRIVEVRKWETIQNSFLIPMRDEHVWRGRVHTTFNQLKNDDYGTVTGRLSSSGPNLQQVPKRNKLTAPLVRSIFVPDEGCLWASADYTQCEPVLLAFYSESKVLLEGYRANPPVDAHQAVANATGLDRETGKRVNQTLITGGGKGVLVQKYGVNPREVDRIWKEYFQKLPEIQKLQKEAAYVFRTRGYLLSLLGRQAHLVERNKDYTAVNRLLQCGNADVIKLKMVEIDEYLDEANCSVQLINNIHDDLSFQFKPEDRPVYNECIRIMQDFSKGQMIELDLPLRCDPGEGKNWAEATFGTAK